MGRRIFFTPPLHLGSMIRKARTEYPLAWVFVAGHLGCLQC